MDDLISRQAAIDAIDKFFAKQYTLKYGERVLKNVPSAERRGRWKPFDLTWGRSVYTCTACGDSFEVPTECGKPMYKFCPYCGAKMVNEDDNTN